MEDTSTKLRCSMTPLSNNEFDAVFWSTLALVAFTLVLEWISHASIDGCTTISDIKETRDDSPNTISRALSPIVVQEQPRSETSPGADTSSTAAQASITAPKTTPPPSTSCMPNVSPNIRANRLITAVFLYAIISALFITRMRDVRVPHLRPECARYTSLDQARLKMPSPNWWFIGLLNILPFICASFSLLRNVVDCLLVRWGQGLGYDGQRKDNTWPWAPFLPLVALWFVLSAAIKILMVFPITCMMGRPLKITWAYAIPRGNERARDDIEMQSEETRRLVDDVNEEEEDQERSADPPAYDEAVYKREADVDEMQHTRDDKLQCAPKGSGPSSTA